MKFSDIGCWEKREKPATQIIKLELALAENEEKNEESTDDDSSAPGPSIGAPSVGVVRASLKVGPRVPQISK